MDRVHGSRTQVITNNAKGLISIIVYEYNLQMQRLEGGFIEQGDVMPCLLERLQAKAKSSVDMKTFLTTMSHVPEDEELTRAEVRELRKMRKSRVHVVDNRKPEGKLSDERSWPTPGERVC